MHIICVVLYSIIILAIIGCYVFEKQPVKWGTAIALGAGILGLGYTIYSWKYQ